MARSTPNGGRGGRGFSRRNQQDRKSNGPAKVPMNKFHPLASAFKENDSYVDLSGDATKQTEYVDNSFQQ